MEIPILMVLLSRILNYRINRWANIIIGTVIIALIIGVGSKDLDDIFLMRVPLSLSATRGRIASLPLLKLSPSPQLSGWRSNGANLKSKANSYCKFNS